MHYATEGGIEGLKLPCNSQNKYFVLALSYLNLHFFFSQDVWGNGVGYVRNETSFNFWVKFHQLHFSIDFQFKYMVHVLLVTVQVLLVCFCFFFF